MQKILTLTNFSLLTIFCAPFYLIRVSFFGLPSNVFELLALSVIILSLLKNKAIFLRKAVSLPVLLQISCTLISVGLILSILLNNNHSTGLGILKGWFAIPFLFSFIVYTAMRSIADLKKIFLSIYLSSALVGALSLGYKLLSITTYDNRLTAFYLSPNHLAMYLAPGIFFGLFFLIESFNEKRFSKKIMIHSGLLLILLTAIYCTYSYGAWLAIIVSIVTTLLISIKKFSLLAILFLLSLFTLLFFSQIDNEKFSSLINSSPRSSFASRQIIWQASFVIIKENIFIGIGPGNFQENYLALQPRFNPYLEWAVPQPHNIFLAFWLQAGLIGFVGFLLLIFFIAQTFWRIFKNKKNTTLAVPLLGFFIYTLLHGLIDTTYWKNDLSFLFWLCLFLMLHIYNSFQEEL